MPESDLPYDEGSDGSSAGSTKRHVWVSAAFAIVLLTGVFLAWGGDGNDAEPAELPTVFEVLNEDADASVALAGEATATPARLDPISTVDELEQGDYVYLVLGTDAPPALVTAAARGVQVGAGPDDLVIYRMESPSSDPDEEDAVSPPATSTTTTPSTTSTTNKAEPPAPAPPAPPDDQPDLTDGSTHAVVTGESFWTISEDQVVASLGRAGTTAEVTQYWAGLVDANLDQLVEAGNPDLLVPGQVLDLPPP